MAAKKKIVVIEDSKLICTKLAVELFKEGFEVVFFHSGKDGFNNVKEHKPDLVILDLILPEIPGEQICKEIRKDQEIGAVPIIMITGKSSDADRVVGRVIGADRYIPKPFDEKSLVEEVKSLLFMTD